MTMSTAMPAQVVSQEVGVPFKDFWAFFSQAQYWTTWNPLFGSIQTTVFELCGPLDAVYTNAPKLPFPPNITAPHAIIQMGLSADGTEAAYSWFFIIYSQEGDMLTYGRHSYTVKDLGNGRTLFSSFEKAAGPQVEKYSFAWTVALEESLLDGVTGAVCLERVWLQYGSLSPLAVKAVCDPFVPQN
eukprot:TRINITY_DN22001_c0_g1_i2.p1 TRINITY_DN22001_c0_g1~~TRINITY_DN22001_c0_g1_i2.p1  ORF type:complete len:186 (+),score=45.54 TRINITY_DN22001_c0_g1_i2:253-810(+)